MGLDFRISIADFRLETALRFNHGFHGGKLNRRTLRLLRVEGDWLRANGAGFSNFDCRFSIWSFDHGFH